MRPGPPLERLTRRLAETPEDFLAEPRIGEGGSVAVAALVADLLGGMGPAATEAEVARFAGREPADRDRLMLAAIAVWLLSDDWAAEAAPARAALPVVLDRRLSDLATGTRAEAFVRDGDRREELARTLLAALGLLPQGETEPQAADRLSAVSAAERRRLLAASQEAEKRARAVREALIRKAAEESADKYTRE